MITCRFGSDGSEHSWEVWRSIKWRMESVWLLSTELLAHSCAAAAEHGLGSVLVSALLSPAGENLKPNQRVAVLLPIAEPAAKKGASLFGACAVFSLQATPDLPSECRGDYLRASSASVRGNYSEYSQVAAR